MIPKVNCPSSSAGPRVRLPEGSAPEPGTQIAPDDWPLPVSVQLVAFVEDQVMVNCCSPKFGVLGLIESVAVGGGGGRMVTVTGAEVVIGLPTSAQVTDNA
jgi:hypothetical protein